MPRSKPAPFEARLWPHQRTAVDLIRRFLSRERADGGAALVRMPTGTGKSGVIAVTAHVLANQGDVLVLAPFDALVDQLVRDIERRFWDRIRAEVPSARKVKRLYPSTAAEELDAADERGDPAIFVTTLATLMTLHDREPQTYARLAKTLATAIVDEGHYEPAPGWSRAVRDLEAPTILFTATPYRNDFKYFEVDDAFFYAYSHHEAEAARFIREVAFHQERWKSAPAFCRQLVAFCRATFGEGQPRVVVRCERADSVRRITQELSTLGVSAIGIHETFTKDEPHLLSEVPDPDLADQTQYWVHQFKLIEGIDHPGFRVLAVFEPLKNERSFVQQVGRILRNPGQQRDQKAWIFSDPSHQLQASWEAYRRYDEAAEKIPYPTAARLAAMQPYQYLDRRFRAPFDLASPAVEDDFDYPLAAQVFVAGGVGIDDIGDAIESEWREEDLELGTRRSPDGSTRLVAYVSLRNSPLLLDKAFIEPEVGFTIWTRTRGYLFFFDSQGRTPDVLRKLERVEPATLERLYQGDDARLTSVSLRNTSLGRYDVRGRTIEAYAVDELGPDLGDHTQFASTATGFSGGGSTGSSVSRYVGFSRSRIRDRVGGAASFTDYKAWTNEVAAQLDRRNGRILPVFERYAEAVRTPRDPRPANILLDFESQLFEEAPGLSRRPARLAIDDLCVDVNPDGAFALTANGRSYDAKIEWIEDARRFATSAPGLNTDYVSRPEVRPVSLLAHLNAEQRFRIILRGTRYTVYAGGRFYRPRIPLWGTATSGRFDLLRLLEPVAELAAIATEKGADASATAGGWVEGSLFHLIDTLGAGTGFAPHLETVNLLVCDDMGRESADFIALDDQRRRVIALHAKAFPQAKPRSASALHEVSAQALKNLGYFQPYFIGKPKNVARWDGPWRGPAGEVARRLRRGATSADTAWGRIRRALRDPEYSREVWLVLGQGLERAAFDRERSQASPPAETVQLLYLLQSAWSSVTTVGGRLRVFCSP